MGLLAVEHHEPGRYGRRELQLVDQLLDPAALAIDNARWFSRLRTIGADEERIRIARDLHDRIGQSLASVGFALDRMAKAADNRSKLAPQLDELRVDVRGVLGEVRDTLSDLRTDVSDDRGLADTLESFLERVGKRGSLEVDFGTAGTGRLPVIQERELWRIAHEAISNVERHARASHLHVWWQCDSHSALLTVTDDGEGFEVGALARADAYGVTGMRERQTPSAPGSTSRRALAPARECRAGWKLRPERDAMTSKGGNDAVRSGIWPTTTRCSATVCAGRWRTTGSMWWGRQPMAKRRCGWPRSSGPRSC